MGRFLSSVLCGSTPRRTKLVVGSCGLFTWVLTSCGSEDQRANPEDSAKVESKRPDGVQKKSFQKSAHQAAFTRLLELSADAFKIARPVQGAQLGLGPLHARSYRPDVRAKAREALRTAQKEALSIDEKHLEAKDRPALQTIRFALEQLRLELNDKAFGTASSEEENLRRSFVSANELLNEFAYRLQAGADKVDADELSDAFSSLQPLLSPPLPSSISESSQQGLLEDCRSLEVRLGSFPNPSLSEFFRKVYESSRAAHLSQLDILCTKVSKLEFKSARDKQKKGKGSAISEKLVRDLLDREFLTGLEYPQIWKGIERNLLRFASMRSKAAQSSTTRKSKLKPVEVCQNFQKTVDSWATRDPMFEHEAVPCSSFIQWAPGNAKDETELKLAYLDRAVIRPMRRRFRSSQHPAIALIPGSWTLTTQLHLRRIMLLSRFEAAKPLLPIVVEEAKDALCLGAAALLTHLDPTKDLGLKDHSPKTERQWWNRHCGDAKSLVRAKQYAALHPHQSLTALPLASFNQSPHEMVGPDRFYWLPYGLTAVLAQPVQDEAERSHEITEGRKDENPLRVKIEAL